MSVREQLAAVHAEVRLTERRCDLRRRLGRVGAFSVHDGASLTENFEITTNPRARIGVCSRLEGAGIIQACPT